MDWESQWKQLKTELDALNPKYDAATARVRELEATLALREKEKADAEASSINLTGSLAQVNGALNDALGKAAESVKTIQDQQAELSKHKAVNAKLLAGLNAANAAQAAASKAITEALHASV